MTQTDAACTQTVAGTEQEGSHCWILEVGGTSMRAVLLAAALFTAGLEEKDELVHCCHQTGHALTKHGGLL